MSPANVIDRSVIRKQFAAFLQPRLVGSGKPAEAVYDHQIGDFKGKSPVVVVTSAGSGRSAVTTSDNTSFMLEVHTFVLYAKENGSWTESQSEDRLDLLEKEISDSIVDANDVGDWLSVVFNGDSEIDGVEIGGEEYRHEVIPVLMTVWDF